MLGGSAEEVGKLQRFCCCRGLEIAVIPTEEAISRVFNCEFREIGRMAESCPFWQQR